MQIADEFMEDGDSGSYWHISLASFGFNFLMSLLSIKFMIFIRLFPLNLAYVTSYFLETHLMINSDDLKNIPLSFF